MKNPQCASRHPSGRRIQMPSKKKIMSSKRNKCYGGEGIGLRGGGEGGGQADYHGDKMKRKKDGRKKAKKNGTLYPSATVQIIKPMAKT